MNVKPAEVRENSSIPYRLASSAISWSRLATIASMLAIGAVFALSADARAADFWSPREAALAGSGHAAPLLNDAIYLNPSYSAFLPTYSIAGNGGWYHGGGDHPDGGHDVNGRNLNVSLQDGRSDLFQAGVAYTVRQDAKVVSFGAARNVVQKLGTGMGTKILLGTGGSSNHLVDAIFSTSYVITDWLQAALVVDNLFQTQDGIDRNMYRNFILGLKANVSGIVIVYFDPHLEPSAPENSFGQQAGLEFPFASDFFLRLGWHRNTYIPHLSERGNGFGVGMGWIGPRLSLDYGFSRTIDPYPAFEHTVGFTIYI